MSLSYSIHRANTTPPMAKNYKPFPVPDDMSTSWYDVGDDTIPYPKLELKLLCSEYIANQRAYYDAPTGKWYIIRMQQYYFLRDLMAPYFPKDYRPTNAEVVAFVQELEDWEIRKIGRFHHIAYNPIA